MTINCKGQLIDLTPESNGNFKRDSQFVFFDGGKYNNEVTYSIKLAK
jgi:hypothetical protein